MNKFLNFGKALWQDESGATAIEYGLLAALIAVVIIGTVASLGEQLDDDVHQGRHRPEGQHAGRDPAV